MGEDHQPLQPTQPLAPTAGAQQAARFTLERGCGVYHCAPLTYSLHLAHLHAFIQKPRRWGQDGYSAGMHSYSHTNG